MAQYLRLDKQAPNLVTAIDAEDNIDEDPGITSDPIAIGEAGFSNFNIEVVGTPEGGATDLIINIFTTVDGTNYFAAAEQTATITNSGVATYRQLIKVRNFFFRFAKIQAIADDVTDNWDGVTVKVQRVVLADERQHPVS